MNTQPLIYRVLFAIGTALQFAGYAMVVIGTWLCGGDGAERVEDETK